MVTDVRKDAKSAESLIQLAVDDITLKELEESMYILLLKGIYVRVPGV